MSPRSGYVALQKGQNPRDLLPRHRERGPSKLEFTFEDLAELASVHVVTARSQFSRWTAKQLPELVSFFVRRFARTARKLTVEEQQELFGPHLPLWEARWPRWELFVCGYPSCDEVLVEDRLCEKHGGKSPMRFVGTNGNLPRVQLRVGTQWTPFARIVAGCPEGKDVQHLDGNRWNDRPENLRAMNHDEHWEEHQKRPDAPESGEDPAS